MLHGQLLFANQQMSIHSYRCNGHDTPHDAEESISWFDIILPRRGLYVYKLGKRELIANVNHVCLVDPSLSYRITHPDGGEDASTVVSIGRGLFRALVGAIDHSVNDISNEKLRFAANQITATSALAYHHYKLISLAQSQQTEQIDVEETAIALCGEVARLSYVHAAKKTKTNRPASQQFYAERANIVKIHLAKHYARSISLQELSHVAAVSPFHLTRIFTASVGMPIHRYLKRLRLNQTLEFLREGEENLTQIALDAGFSSHSHYTAASRAEFGQTPSQIRAVLRRKRI